MIIYRPKDFEEDIDLLAEKLRAYNVAAGLGNGFKTLYGIPRGGVPVATALAGVLGLCLTDNPAEADLIVDDLIDSRATMSKFPGKPFACLHVKPHSPRPQFFAKLIPNEWIKYFWEGEDTNTIQKNLVRCLQFIGEDPTREGLLETPNRIVKAWKEMFAGYTIDPESLFKNFDGEGIGGLVYLKDIEFQSTCEHHMLPFFGNAMIAYIPNGKIIGISKLARLLDIFARRMQVQERIGEQVTSALMEHLKPLGAACIIEAKHLCISCRGVKKQHSVMGYSSMKGIFLDNSPKGAAARAELMTFWGQK